MRLSHPLPTGVSALLFDSARRLRRLETALAAELEAAGFDEAILPVVDYLEPYEPVLTSSAKGELYRFADREGEMLALRADFTPLLARLVAPHLAALTLPRRIFYRGDVVRCPPRGARDGAVRSDAEQYQLGGELLGRKGDGEMLAREAARMAGRLLARAAGGSATLVLGATGALGDLLAVAEDEAGAAALARAVSRRERAAVRALRAGGSAGAAAGTALLEVVERGVPDEPSVLGGAGAAALGELESLQRELAVAFPELHVAIDLAEFADVAVGASAANGEGARGYYDGIVFRGYLAGSARPVVSGGRYDELFARLGAGGISAAGFSLRLDELVRAGEVASPVESCA
ncbi:MAG: ATP phosphoribosyltransferase regulatory subunit [Thermoanaerobaculia bacterium]